MQSGASTATDSTREIELSAVSLLRPDRLNVHAVAAAATASPAADAVLDVVELSGESLHEYARLQSIALRGSPAPIKESIVPQPPRSQEQQVPYHHPFISNRHLCVYLSVCTIVFGGLGYLLIDDFKRRKDSSEQQSTMQKVYAGMEAFLTLGFIALAAVSVGCLVYLGGRALTKCRTTLFGDPKTAIVPNVPNAGPNPLDIPLIKHKHGPGPTGLPSSN